jgi:predicted ATPase/class 3 adenylate cyclase
MAPDSLPSGTVTFLFTDIQGSTQLWQQYPAAMPQALERHHAILRQTIEGWDGYVFQIIGDAFCAAFHTARDGLNAAIEAQRQLQAEPWGETGPIRVRMALHSGAVDLHTGEFTSGEYASGLTLSRAARLLSAGHGGQTLLSMSAAELVGDQIPVGIDLLDLGSHRLKDLVRPEHIFQAVTADLPRQFPPLKTLDSRPHNLPMQLTSFIGRQRELVEITGTLQRPAPDTRLLTLVGPGGTGKTRLALQVAADLIDDFPDGVWFVDLSPLIDPELIPQAVAAAWGLREQPWRPLSEVLADYLGGKQLLLVLDNCEHLVEASAMLSQALLQAPGVKILATSREPLGVMGEVIYRVPTLSLPGDEHPQTPETLTQYEAVRLFIDRATAARSDFTITQANALAVAQICRRLDGIPLAIELAAARLRAFSIDQVAARLEDRFRLLTGGSRTSLPRQQTLRALIDWSYNLLSAQERLLFQRLAVFAGGWPLEAAEAVCSGGEIEPYDVFDLLGRLVDRSLVVANQGGEQPRYRMLETLRQYARERLLASGEATVWENRHLAFYLDLSLSAEPKLQTGEDIIWLQRLEDVQDNLRAALDMATKSDNTRVALQLCGALYYYWLRSGHIQEGMSHTLRVMGMPGLDQYPLEMAHALQALGMLYWLNGAYQPALETLDRCITLINNLRVPALFIEALAMSYRAFTYMRLPDFGKALQDGQAALARFRELQNTYGLAMAHYALGRIAIEQGKFADARPDMEQALQWGRKAGDRLVISLVVNSLELLATSRGDFLQAEALNQESLELARQMKDVWMVSGALREAGNLAQARGDYLAASEYFLKSGDISRQQGLLNDYARTRFNLGYVAILLGELPAGRAHLRESQVIFDRMNHRRGLVECLDGYAALAAAEGKYELAAQLLGTGDAIFQSLGARRWPVDQIEYDRLQAKLTERLGILTFIDNYIAGEKLSLEAALILGDNR